MTSSNDQTGRKMNSRLSAHLLVQPASHHHRDIEVSLNGLVSLAKAVHLPCSSGALREREKCVVCLPLSRSEHRDVREAVRYRETLPA